MKQRFVFIEKIEKDVFEDVLNLLKEKNINIIFFKPCRYQ